MSFYIISSNTLPKIQKSFQNDKIPSSSEFTLGKYSNCFSSHISEKVRESVLEYFNQYAKEIEQANSSDHAFHPYRNVKTADDFFTLVQNRIQKERWLETEKKKIYYSIDYEIEMYGQNLQHKIQQRAWQLRDETNFRIYILATAVRTTAAEFYKIRQELIDDTEAVIKDYVQDMKDIFTKYYAQLKRRRECLITDAIQEAEKRFPLPTLSKKEPNIELVERWKALYGIELDETAQEALKDLSDSEDEEERPMSTNSIRTESSMMTNAEDSSTSSTASPFHLNEMFK